MKREDSTPSPSKEANLDTLSGERHLPAEEDHLPSLLGENVEPPPTIPLKYRLVAFVMIVFFSSGSSYAQAVISPLKSTLRKELGINNAQYGAIASADNLINAILPIIGGIGIDYWGAT